MSEANQSGGRADRHLSPELQAMWRRENKGNMQGKSRDEKLAHRKQLREKVEGMSEAEFAGLRGDLQAKWDALSAEEKQKLSEKLAKKGEGKQKKGGKAGGRGKAKRKGKKGGAGQE